MQYSLNLRLLANEFLKFCISNINASVFHSEKYILLSDLNFKFDIFRSFDFLLSTIAMQ